MATNTDLIQKLYVAYFNRPADVSGLNYWLAAMDNGATIDQVSKSFNAAAEYTAAYNGKSPDNIVDTVYMNLFGRHAEAGGLDFWAPKVQSGAISVADLVKTIAAGAVNADGTPNADGAALANKVTAAEAFTTEIGTAGNEAERLAYASGTAAVLAAAKAYIASVSDDASLATAVASVHATAQGLVTVTTPSTTYNLTVSVDPITAGAGDDVFNASYDTAAGAHTLSGLDKLDGGAGNDTLNITDAKTGGGNIDVSLPTSVTNIETVNITSVGNLSGDAADISGWDGVTQANIIVKDGGVVQTITAATTTGLSITNSGATGVTVVGGGGVATINAKGAVQVGNSTGPGAGDANAFTSVSVTGATSTVKVTDNSGASGAIGSKLTTVSIGAATTGNIDLEGKGLVNVSATKLAHNLTITNATAGHTANLTLNGATAGTILDTAATTVAVTSTGKANSGTTLDMNTLVTTLTVGGDKAFSTALTNDTLVTSLTSTNTAGTTITSTLQTTTAATFGAGADAVTIGATTKAISMGAGDDTVTLTTVGTGGTVAGGAGNDTLSMTAASAVTASATTTFAGQVTGFEILKLAANAAANPSVDLSKLNTGGANSIHTVEFAGTNTDSITLANMTSGDTIQFDASQTAAKTVTASVTGALASTADVLNVKVTGAAAIDAKILDASNVETLKFVTNDTANDADATVATTHLQHTVALTDAALVTVTVTGDAGLSLTNTATTLTSFDASGVTDGTVTFTTGALAAASTIKGGAYANVIDFSAATKAVTYTGGAKADTLNWATANTKANVINLGDGTNAVNGATNANGDNTITGGTGADTIAVGTGANTIHLGGGTTANSVTVGIAAGLNVIDTTSTGVDTMGFTGVQTAAGYYTTLTGWAKGDVINFSGTQDGATGLSAATTLGSKIVLGGASSFANYLDAAAASATAHTATVIDWFQFGGNTYIVHDTSNNVTFSDGHDTVICLTGLVDLSTATLGTTTGIVTLG